MKETRSSPYVLAVCELTFQDMWCLTSTIPEVEFLCSPIHLQWIHLFHCIHNSHHCRHYEIATCNVIEIIMRLEENHKFLVIETPRSALFFNHVTSGFACPTQNKKISPQHWRIQWIQVSSYSHALPCSHMESTVFSPKLECDLWRMVVIFKFNKNTSIKCNRNLTLLYKFQQKSTTPITSALQTNNGSHEAMSNSHLPKLSNVSKKISLILHT